MYDSPLPYTPMRRASRLAALDWLEWDDLSHLSERERVGLLDREVRDHLVELRRRRTLHNPFA
jgi:hypothetical protein